MTSGSGGGRRPSYAAICAARAAGAAERLVGRATAPLRNVGFPYRPPTVPRGVEVPAEPPTLGADYDTDWARSPVAKTARSVVVAGPQRLLLDWLTDPEINGHDRLADLLRCTDGDKAGPPSVIFAPNHHSHLDTALMVRAVPAAWRPHLVTAAAADYFFDKRWKAVLAALALNAIPVDREVTNRKSADLMAGLLEDGWSLVIYPEGDGRRTGGARRSGAAPPTWPGAPAPRSSRSTSTARTRSWARAPACPSQAGPG